MTVSKPCLSVLHSNHITASDDRYMKAALKEKSIYLFILFGFGLRIYPI